MRRLGDSDRLRRRALDACLDVLENDHERGELVISSRLGSTLQQYVLSIVPGMLIADAIELVFQEQERLAGGERSPWPAFDDESVNGRAEGLEANERTELADASARPISVTEARCLTEQIRTATRMVCLLLLEAYDGQAWFALGFRNWEEYVRCALGFRRSRAYELLDQARTIRALQAAAHTSDVPDVSAYAAEQIKAQLPEVLEAVRARAATVPNEQAVEVIVDVVQEHRRVTAQRREPTPAGEAPVGQLVEATELDLDIRRTTPAPLGAALGAVEQLLDAINYLADLPVIEGEAMVDRNRLDLEAMERALGWLVEFEGSFTAVPAEAAEDERELVLCAPGAVGAWV